MRPLTCILVVGERTTLLYYSVGPGGLEPLPIKDEIYSLAAVSERLSVPNFVPRDRIELSPFACKTNTLPLRQQGLVGSDFYVHHTERCRSKLCL